MATKKEKASIKKPTQKNISDYKVILSQMSTSQCQKILRHLIKYHRITTYQAFQKYGCTRLPARISDLRQMGVNIYTENASKKMPDGTYKHFGIYRLV